MKSRVRKIKFKNLNTLLLPLFLSLNCPRNSFNRSNDVDGRWFQFQAKPDK